MFPTQRHLAENSFIVQRHVTQNNNKTMQSWKKFQKKIKNLLAANKVVLTFINIICGGLSTIFS